MAQPYYYALALYALAFLLFCGCTEKRQQNLLGEADKKLNIGQHRQAEELYRKVVALNPENYGAQKAIYKLGFLFETYLKDYAAALFNYEEFIRLHRDPVRIYEVLKRIGGIYFDNLNNFDKAIEVYKKASELDPNSLERDFFQFRIAQAFYRQNNFEQARFEYQKLVADFPKSQYVARVRLEIGNTYFMEGKYDIALDALKQVLRLHPQSPFAVDAEFLLGQCLEHQEKLLSALQTYQNLIGRYPATEVLDDRIAGVKKRMQQKK